VRAPRATSKREQQPPQDSCPNVVVVSPSAAMEATDAIRTVLRVAYEGQPGEEELWDCLYYGSPDRIIEKFRRLAEGGNWMMAGGMEHEKIMKSIPLMGEKVIRALRDVRPPPDLPQRLVAAAETPEALAARGPAPSE